MQQLKATVNFVDSAKRAVVLTEDNQAIVIYEDQFDNHKKGDEIVITREDGKRRASDWRISK